MRTVGAFMGAAGAALVTATGALAAQPEDGGMNFQPPATPVMEDIHAFHGVLLPIITAISLFVLGLLAYVILRYNKRANPKPKTFTHNTTVEIVWTAVPVAILAVISWFSFPLLYKQDVLPPDVDMTIKATGYAWYWGYEYPDHDIGEYISNMIPDNEIDPAKGQLKKLSVNFPMVAPEGATVRVITTGADVIHSFAMPAFGVKIDSIPGRLNETWFRVDEAGTYYGQCSELCGKYHAFMPIEARIVPQDVFDRWAAVAAESGGDSPEAVAILDAYDDRVRRTQVASR